VHTIHISRDFLLTYVQNGQSASLLHITFTVKLEVVGYSQEHANIAAGRQFNVDEINTR
jgi:hypothetical protein